MEQFIEQYKWWIVIGITVWSFPWKGVALWKAAGAKNKLWFIILLLVNTLGILEIIYIFLIEIKKDESNNFKDQNSVTRLKVDI
jgi:hypothetical protein